MAEETFRLGPLLFCCEKDLLWLPGRIAILANDTFHQRNQFTLCAYTSYTISNRRIRGSLHAVPVTHTFHLIRAEFDGRPVTQRFGGGNQVLIPVPGMKRFLQFAERSGIAQRETPAFGTA